MEEKLSSQNQKVDLLRQRSANLLTKSTQTRSHNEKRSERRTNTERAVSDVDNEVAADLIRLRLNSKKENLEKAMQGKENFYRKKTSIWSSKTLQEIDNEVHELKEKQVGRTISL